jgi:transcriptional regulator with XRE-family HTH domain
MSLSARIRMAREAAGLSQSALARAVKVNPSAVNHMESGRTKALRAETILALASALSVSAYWLETGNGSPSPDARLSPEETEALSIYRLLTTANRDAFLSVGRTLLSAQPATRATTAHPFQTAKRVR